MNLWRKLFGGRLPEQPRPAKPGAIESRLVLEDRDLYGSIRNASEERRRRAAIAAARWAVERVGLRHPAVDAAFSCLGTGRPPGPAVISAVEKLAEDLDLEDCRLQDQDGDESTQKEASVAFRQARAAGAVAFALAGDAAGCIYEVIHATQELPKVREIVASELGRA